MPIAIPKRPLKMRVVERKLGRESAAGQTVPGECVNGVRILEVDPRQHPRDFLDTVIHEALHQLCPENSEEWVEFAGTSMATLLWKLGYRRADLK